MARVETLRKPSTGLKRIVQPGLTAPGGAVETLRKPSTGLKRPADVRFIGDRWGRDTQKTQHGIETGLIWIGLGFISGRDTQKTQHGIETDTRPETRGGLDCRDTQKTQHGIETRCTGGFVKPPVASRHSENPARD